MQPVYAPSASEAEGGSDTSITSSCVGDRCTKTVIDDITNSVMSASTAFDSMAAGAKRVYGNPFADRLDIERETKIIKVVRRLLEKTILQCQSGERDNVSQCFAKGGKIF